VIGARVRTIGVGLEDAGVSLQRAAEIALHERGVPDLLDPRRWRNAQRAVAIQHSSGKLRRRPGLLLPEQDVEILIREKLVADVVLPGIRETPAQVRQQGDVDLVASQAVQQLLPQHVRDRFGRHTQPVLGLREIPARDANHGHRGGKQVGRLLEESQGGLRSFRTRKNSAGSRGFRRSLRFPSGQMTGNCRCQKKGDHAGLSRCASGGSGGSCRVPCAPF